MNRQEAIALGLKKGSKLYNVCYFDCRNIPASPRDFDRSYTTLTVKQLNPKNMTFYGGYAWRMPYSDIGVDYFLSKKEMFKDALENHEEQLAEVMRERVKPLEKEIEYLKRKLGEASNE